ncbi:MAG: tRNA (cytosine(32)/uridine(32)-2'-O)-methyltransferase TrmJ, partial [Chromatiales bacterium]|nr:tRNA (cytosine(32)/uridine(32)-2'-O)-methyltransferase TrmJ [Chromatiales bacterium]
MSSENLLDAVRIVLVETTHPGNIGAVARAMKNMGLSDLRLLRPRHFPDGEARARASGAGDVLAAAQVHQSLDDAIAECGLVIGASARLRSLAWPMTTPREAAGTLVENAAHTPVAVLFGREKSGLTNEELQRCRLLMHIPANPV